MAGAVDCSEFGAALNALGILDAAQTMIGTPPWPVGYQWAPGLPASADPGPPLVDDQTLVGYPTNTMQYTLIRTLNSVRHVTDRKSVV